jgi:hypothetical protein
MSDPNIPFLWSEEVLAWSVGDSSEETRRAIANKRPSKRKALEPIFLSNIELSIKECIGEYVMIRSVIPFFICRPKFKRVRAKKLIWKALQYCWWLLSCVLHISCNCTYFITFFRYSNTQLLSAFRI